MLEWINLIFDFLINRPLVMLVLMALPWLFAAWALQLFPSRRFLLLMAVPAVLSVALIQVRWDEAGDNRQFWMLAGAVWALDVGILACSLADAWLTLRPGSFSCQRRLLRTASQGKRYEVELELINRSRRSVRLMLRDDTPANWTVDPEEFETRLGGRSRTQFTYDFTSQQRGQVELECVHLRVASPLGLWWGYYRLPHASVVNVYPDMKQISEYDLLARTNRLNLMGMRRTRKIGQDNEFERLRDYTQDDQYKHIDWRSTARRRKLTVRDFQANQSQRIIFLVDCGRMMTGVSGELTLLDHSINAMLMLSYVALRQGDSVGVITFSDRVHNFTPARSGVQHINRLLHAAYNQSPSYVESRYDEAFLYLRHHCHKRALVVLVTNVIDEINALQIKQYLSVLNRKHLPLAVLLRDHELYQPLQEYENEPYPRESTIYQAAAAVNVLSWRHQVIRDLQHQGILALDVFPEQLTAELVNQYLEIKARHLL